MTLSMLIISIILHLTIFVQFLKIIPFDG